MEEKACVVNHWWLKSTTLVKPGHHSPVNDRLFDPLPFSYDTKDQMQLKRFSLAARRWHRDCEFHTVGGMGGRDASPSNRRPEL
jgi:hypothetical protein